MCDVIDLAKARSSAQQARREHYKSAQQAAFSGLIEEASARPCHEPWLDSLSVAAGPGRALLADADGVCAVVLL